MPTLYITSLTLVLLLGTLTYHYKAVKTSKKVLSTLYATGHVAGCLTVLAGIDKLAELERFVAVL